MVYILAELRTDFVLDNVYPADLSAYPSNYNANYCRGEFCKEAHFEGKASEQWAVPGFVHRKTNQENYDFIGFLEKLKVNGVTTPVEVDIRDHFVLFNGHHRTMAAGQLGIKWIPAEIDNRYAQNEIPSRYIRRVRKITSSIVRWDW